MAEKDAIERALEDYEDVFADIVNVLLFNGQRRVRSGDLEAAAPRSYYKAGGKIRNQERDVAKYWRQGGERAALFGLENQTRVDSVMPLRAIGYDGADYRNQIRRERTGKGRRKRRSRMRNSAFPVVTMILHFGYEAWRQERTLCGKLAIPEGLEPYVNDYRINVFEIAYLPQETIAQFQSDFRCVAEAARQVRLLKEGKIREFELKDVCALHPEETRELLLLIMGEQKLDGSVQVTTDKGGNVRMGFVREYYEKRGEERGEKRGRKLGREEADRYRISTMLKYGKTPEAIHEFCGYSMKKIAKVERQLGAKKDDHTEEG